MCIKRSTFNCNGFYITFWCTIYGVRVQNLLLHFPHISVGDGRKDDRMQHVQSLSLCKSHCLVFSKGEHADIFFCSLSMYNIVDLLITLYANINQCKQE